MKKGLLLMVLILGILLVGCGKEKEVEITSENIVAKTGNENIDVEKLIDEFYTNEKYSQKINGITCFNPEYKELIFSIFLIRGFPLESLMLINFLTSFSLKPSEIFLLGCILIL